jgi:hypothetical protein
MAVYKDKLMVTKWNNKKHACLTSTAHDEKLVQTKIQGQVVKKPKVATDYSSIMGGEDMCDAHLVNYHSIRKRLKKTYYQKHFQHLIYICCTNSNLLYKK